MKTIVFLCAVLACATCRPQFGFDRALGFASNAAANILRYDFVNDIGSYFFDVDTSDGFHHDARGRIAPATSTEDEALEVQGSYSYIGPDGKNYTVNYIADKDGFRPQGAHLPPSAGVRPLGVGKDCLASICGTGLG